MRNSPSKAQLKKVVRVRGGPKGYRLIPLGEWIKEKAQGRGKQR